MRKDLLPLLALLALLAAGFVGYRLLFGEETSLVLLDASGDVRRTDALGVEAPLAAGAELDVRDRVVAGADGKAVIGLGDQTRVTLEQSSSVRVLGVDATGVRLELEGGRVQATVRPGSGSVGIVARDTEIKAVDADFSATRGADGAFGVRTDRGSVAVRGVDGVSEVTAGNRLLVPSEGAPLVQPASEALLLYVADPASARVREAAATVHGKTVPGARVRVKGEGDWREVHADAKGEWTAEVALAEGANDVKVEATDVFGNVATSSVSVVRDTTAPAVGVEIHF